MLPACPGWAVGTFVSPGAVCTVAGPLRQSEAPRFCVGRWPTSGIIRDVLVHGRLPAILVSWTVSPQLQGSCQLLRGCASIAQGAPRHTIRTHDRSQGKSMVLVGRDPKRQRVPDPVCHVDDIVRDGRQCPLCSHKADPRSLVAGAAGLRSGSFPCCTPLARPITGRRDKYFPSYHRTLAVLSALTSHRLRIRTRIARPASLIIIGASSPCARRRTGHLPQDIRTLAGAYF